MSNEFNGYIYLSPLTESKLLAMLYMNQQNLKDLSPEELAKKYRSVQTSIKDNLKSSN